MAKAKYVEVKCFACKGSGRNQRGDNRCRTCEGRKMQEYLMELCHMCKGKGGFADGETCHTCEGKGVNWWDPNARKKRKQ